MLATSTNLYQAMAQRTGGDVYIGVVGPVRTGKSTFVKRVMETLVIPHIENPYQRERARDELPQSASGRTIMTAEPKFVPEEAVEISPDGKARWSVRMIDSVGYLIPGAIGADEDGQARMVTTPWFPQEISMKEAAELGTKKIMEEHCTAAVLVTTDGTVTDIPLEDYLEAEARSIADLKATGKPFVVLLNSADPGAELAQTRVAEIEGRYDAACLAVNCLTMDEGALGEVLSRLLYAFPVTEVAVYLPRWLGALPMEHPVKAHLFEALLEQTEAIATLAEADEALQRLEELEEVERFTLRTVEPGSGRVACAYSLREGLYYQVLSERSGFEVHDDRALLALLEELARVKRDYDKVASALEQVRATGYGIVMPTAEEMHLEVPQIVRRGGNYGVRLKASAPSIHMLRADIETEIHPIVGDEKQSEELLRYLISENEGDTEKLWSSNIFGKSVYELVGEGLSAKLKRMPQEAQMKLQATLSRIINEGSTGLLCIIFA